MEKQANLTKRIKKKFKPKRIKTKTKKADSAAEDKNNHIEPIIEEKPEGKKYVMKALQMKSEFESFYSHGEACLIGKRYFGKKPSIIQHSKAMCNRRLDFPE